MTPTRRPSDRQARRGFTVLEVIVSLILLGTILGMIVPLARKSTDQTRLAERRRVAVLEVSNALERLAADPASAPAAGEERTLSLSEEAAGRLREPVLTVRAEPLAGPIAGRRLDAALTWAEPSGTRSAPVRLSAFVFEEASP